MKESEEDDVAMRGVYDWANTRASLTIVDALAAIEGISAVELSAAIDGTLYDRLDPEALDTIVSGNDGTVVSFTIDDYLVRIDGSELTIRTGVDGSRGPRR